VDIEVLSYYNTRTMPTALRVSEAASLGLHAAAMLAAATGRRLTAAQMAGEMGVSQAHLSKVLQRMKGAGLVDSGRGPTGGFSLALPPGKVSLLDVYCAVEGNLTLSSCLLPRPMCDGENCILGDVMRTVNRELRRRLEHTTLDELAGVFGLQTTEHRDPDQSNRTTKGATP